MIGRSRTHVAMATVGSPVRCCWRVFVGVLLLTSIAVLLPAALMVVLAVAVAVPGGVALNALKPVAFVWLWWLVLPYCVHEWLYIAALSVGKGTTLLRVEVGLSRVSVAPVEALSAARAGGAAISGPVGTAVLGLAATPWMCHLGLPWWISLPWMLHGMFLAPFFGDGKSLVTSLKAHTSAR